MIPPAVPAGSGPTSLGNRFRRMLMIPRVAALGAKAPRNPTVAWDRFWHDVRSTGTGGDVLWDLDTEDEFTRYRSLMGAHFDCSLPIIDIGCGNGRFTRWLASMFPLAVGIDMAATAVDRARAESGGRTGLDFVTMDATDRTAGSRLNSRYGDANIFVRGVFHVLDHSSQLGVAATARRIAGNTGGILLAETDFRGSGLAYLQHLGATARSIPMPLQRAIGGLPRPGQFGSAERANCFPDDQWQLIVDGPTEIKTVPMRSTTQPENIPGYVAVLVPRR
jgi:SAM-dependent methyltransferase